MKTNLAPRKIRRNIIPKAMLSAVVVAAGLMAGAGPASAATATVNTDSGASVIVHSGSNTSSANIGSVADGASISIDCQTYGETVTGKYGTSNIWDHIPAKGGYVTDTYVYTGSDGLVAPLCSGTTTPSCSISGTGDPRTCAEAVSWAKAHETTSYHSEYVNMCDHIMGLAYGFPASGSTTAYMHWTQIPGSFKHAGNYTVPAGGLAFFSGGAGHVMISIGGGKFVSNDINGSGTLTETTIASVKSKWGKPYLGWAQPWFKYNH